MPVSGEIKNSRKAKFNELLFVQLSDFYRISNDLFSYRQQRQPAFCHLCLNGCTNMVFYGKLAIRKGGFYYVEFVREFNSLSG